jgi:hypothetical protein
MAAEAAVCPQRAVEVAPESSHTAVQAALSGQRHATAGARPTRRAPP